MRLATSVRIQDPLGFLLQSLMPPLAEAGLGGRGDAGKGNKESRGGKKTVQRKTLKKKSVHSQHRQERKINVES